MRLLWERVNVERGGATAVTQRFPVQRNEQLNTSQWSRFICSQVPDKPQKNTLTHANSSYLLKMRYISINSSGCVAVEGALADGFRVISPLTAVGLRKQVLDTNGNQLTMPSGHIDITVSSTWLEHLLWLAHAKTCSLCRVITPIINMPQISMVSWARWAGNWVLMAEEVWWQTHSEQGGCRETGCQGGWKRVESNSFHIWEELHTPVTEVHGYLHSANILTCCPALPCTTQPLHSEKCVTWKDCKISNTNSAT